MNNEGTWEVVWIQPFTGSQQVIHSGLDYREALDRKSEYDNNMTGFGGAVIVRGAMKS
ncbi:hypothetical protein [Desulfoscipio geothermicus]|jgi:CRISPR/Cas system CMR-associated protein Cmr3 (group 5 of RAMP superfamily)|uniref:Uncharacterized protein n=1 Tax=Desulfoscipio geothermicus DSM 3669 TaxID=1121426 RepID=A0A1I6D4S7_9FIRM|nr:hypothetical protein [Desulfoscipio geothermicus]SFR00496.1 hypothetical protein SAMN05660706_105119 [Desulfoscipio geothermicus DSM 3669]